MVHVLPIVIIVIGVVLVAVGFIVRRKQVRKLEEISNKQKKALYAQWIIGIALALIAAAFMIDGDILGERTVGISLVLAIAGMCLIATSNVNLLSLKRK